MSGTRDAPAAEADVAQQFDAIVAGGGPAGAWTACGLAQRGWRTALLERGSPGRNKACGNCLHPRILPLLSRAGLGKMIQHAAQQVTSIVRLHVGDAAPLYLPHAASDRISGIEGGLVVDRSNFDQRLRDAAAQAGASVQYHRTVTGVQPEREGARVHVRERGGRKSSLTAGLVIGADGLASGVARMCGLDRGRGRRRDRCGWGFSFDANGCAVTGLQPGAIEMFVTRAGYLGIVKQRDGSLHLGALVWPHRSGDQATSPDAMAFVRELAAAFSVLRASPVARLTRGDVMNFSGAAPMPWGVREPAARGVALVGDAAGYVEPFTGEGMSWAIESAQVLVDVAQRCVPGRWSATAARAYRRAWQRRIGRGHRRCALFAACLRRHTMLRAAFRARPLPDMLAPLLARQVAQSWA